MNCPACDNELRQITVEDVAVDICEGGCGGVFFDRFELQKVDEPHEGAGEMLLDIVRDDAVAVDHTAKRDCPNCVKTQMLRHFYSVARQVEVDECPRCAGIWFDYGELGRIRGLYASEDERCAAAEAYFDDIFGGELAEMRRASEEGRKKARRISKGFRFISPRSWSRQKDDWDGS